MEKRINALEKQSLEKSRDCFFNYLITAQAILFPAAPLG